MTPLEYAEQIAYSTKETIHFTYDCAKKLKDLPGCYVEAGVAAGAQIIAMAYAAPNKTIYAFDSFQGIPLPSNKDDQMPGIRMLTFDEQRDLPNPGEQKLESSGATSVSENDFWKNIGNAFDDGYDAEIITISGWFEKSIPKWIEDKPFAPADGISLLRLDSDLYNSTMVCLKNLYPRMISPGCVIIDDWQLTGCRAACDEYFKSINEKPNYKYIGNIAYFTI